MTLAVALYNYRQASKFLARDRRLRTRHPSKVSLVEIHFRVQLKVNAALALARIVDSEDRRRRRGSR